MIVKIGATGMLTAVGATAPASCAAIHAGIDGFQKTLFGDGAGFAVVGAQARRAVPGKLGLHLLAHMAHRVITECSVGMDISLIPLLLAVSPVDRAGRPERLDEKIMPVIEDLMGKKFHPASCLFPMGETGCFHAVRHARELFADGQVKGCLVCGTDSLINDETLKSLRHGKRLKMKSNPDGLIPGEAAACVYISSLQGAAAEGDVLIRGLGFGHEKAAVTSDEPVTGIGLADAIRRALSDSGLTMEDVDFKISAISGERYGFVETNYALARVLRMRKEFFDFLHLMDTIGAVGAASGACVLAYLKHLFDRGAVSHNGALCETCSDSGDRAVAIVTRYVKGGR